MARMFIETFGYPSMPLFKKKTIAHTLHEHGVTQWLALRSKGPLGGTFDQRDIQDVRIELSFLRPRNIYRGKRRLNAPDLMLCPGIKGFSDDLVAKLVTGSQF